jgi:hypothetical protein
MEHAEDLIQKTCSALLACIIARHPIFICLCYIAVLQTDRLTLDVWLSLVHERMLNIAELFRNVL